MLDFSQLRCFVAVAEELHFGRAATRLNMTQPPLSRQIQILERVLDVRLIDRTSRSVRLTAAGRSLLPEAQRILRLAETATYLTRQVAAGRAGTLKLGFTAATSHDFLPRIITAFRRLYPDVTVALREMVSKDQVEALLSGQIDAGLVRPPVTHPDLNLALAVSEPLLVAIPEPHELAKQRSLSLRDLDRVPFIMYSPHEARYFHDLLVSLFSEAGVQPNVLQQLTQIHSILALVRATLGLALVPAAAKNLRFDGIVFSDLSLPVPKQAELYLSWRRDQDNPLVACLVSIIQDRPK